MLAIDNHVRDVACGNACVIEQVTWLGLAARRQEHRDVVNTAIGYRRRKREDSVPSNKGIVSRVKLQFEGVPRSSDQADNGATHGEAWLRAYNLYVGDVPAHSPSAVYNSAGLRRLGRLRKNGDRISSAGGNRR